MASETVDPIDWSQPPPYTGQYLLSSTYCTLQCGLQITRLAALSQPRTCDLRIPRPTHCLCGHPGYKVFISTQGIRYLINKFWKYCIDILVSCWGCGKRQSLLFFFFDKQHYGKRICIVFRFDKNATIFSKSIGNAELRCECSPVHLCMETVCD